MKDGAKVQIAVYKCICVQIIWSEKREPKEDTNA